MDDDEFKNRVLESLARLDAQVASYADAVEAVSDSVGSVASTSQAVSDRLTELQERMNTRMDALAQRLDDQDMAHDLLVGKVDRYAQNPVAALEAAEQALNRTTSLSRRVSRLEQPDD